MVWDHVVHQVSTVQLVRFVLYILWSSKLTFTDVHTKFEEEVSTFLGTESAIIYSQAYATISSAIPAFAKRGDIIVADRGVNFAIHKGLEISRCTIKWYAHNDMKDLERVLQNVEKEQKRKGGRLTRRFIVSEGVFENDGMMVDLPNVVSWPTRKGI
jgi:serine palmitoyltransferase